MSLKDTIEQWSAGIAYAEAGQYDEAVDKWTEMAEPGAKIHFNVASMFLKLGDLENAERVSIRFDEYQCSYGLCSVESGALSQEGSAFGSVIFPEGLHSFAEI